MSTDDFARSLDTFLCASIDRLTSAVREELSALRSAIDALTSAAASLDDEPPSQVLPKRPYRCRSCGETGHNSATCSSLKDKRS